MAPGQIKQDWSARMLKRVQNRKDRLKSVRRKEREEQHCMLANEVKPKYA